MKKYIHRIEIGTECHRFYEVGVNGITRIDNNSCEYPDHVDRQYDVFVGETLFCQIIDMPVVVFWREVNE